MKIINPHFLKAKSDKKLETFVVIQRNEQTESHGMQLRTYMRLCIKNQEQYTDRDTTNYVETDTEFRVQNYTRSEGTEQRSIHEICFHHWISQQDSHVITFLKAIHKNSDVRFTIKAFIYMDTEHNPIQVKHELYGMVDQQTYFLHAYFGPDNTASPIK
jgi:hypothetical protein